MKFLWKTIIIGSTIFDFLYIGLLCKHIKQSVRYKSFVWIHCYEMQNFHWFIETKKFQCNTWQYHNWIPKVWFCFDGTLKHLNWFGIWIAHFYWNNTFSVKSIKKSKEKIWTWNIPFRILIQRCRTYDRAVNCSYNLINFRLLFIVWSARK